jgi:hypothetical protein
MQCPGMSLSRNDDHDECTLIDMRTQAKTMAFEEIDYRFQDILPLIPALESSFMSL